MSTVEIALNVRLFQAAEIDLEAGKILTQQNRCQPAIYHFQQAYEKCIKAYYSLKEIIDNHTPETEIYRKLINLRHDTQRSTIQLLHDIADIQKHAAEEAIVKYRKFRLRIHFTMKYILELYHYINSSFLWLTESILHWIIWLPLLIWK